MTEYKDPDRDPVMNSSPEELRTFVKTLISIVQAQNVALNVLYTNQGILIKGKLKQAYMEERQEAICEGLRKVWANFLMHHDTFDQVMVECDHCGKATCISGELIDDLENAGLLVEQNEEGWFDLDGFHPIDQLEDFGEGLEDDDRDDYSTDDGWPKDDH